MKSGCFSVLAVLVVHQLLHEQVVDAIQLLVAVQRAQQLLAVFHNGLQDHQAVLLGGFLVGAKAGGASTNTGNGYELEAIAACTIGGVSTTGGVGTVPGVLVGVLVFELMKVALQFMNVNSSYTYIVQGLVIIVAVAIDIRKYLAKK